MAAQKWVLEIDGDSSGVQKAVSGLSASTIAVGNLMADAVKKGIELVGQAISYAVDQAGKAVTAAAEQERAELSLAQAMRQAGTFTKEAFNRNIELASSLQALTTYDDDQIISVQKKLSVYGIHGKQLEDLTKATLDFATAKEMDLASAAEVVAKTVGTEMNALSRYGVAVEGAAGSTEKATNTAKALSDLFGGSAQADTNSFSGAITNIKNQLGEASEGMGNAIVQNKAMGVVFDYVRKAVADLNAWIIKNKDDIMIFVNTALLFCIDGFITLVGAIKWVATLLGMAGTGFMELGNIVLKVVAFIIGGWEQLLQAMVLGLSKIPLVGDKFKAVGDVITGVFTVAKNTVNELGDGFSKTADTIAAGTIGVYDGLTKLQDGATGFRNAIEEAGSGTVATLQKIDVKQTELSSALIAKNKATAESLKVIWTTGNKVITDVSTNAANEMIKNQKGLGESLEISFKKTLANMAMAEIDAAVGRISIKAAEEIGKAIILAPLSLGLSLLAIGGIAAAATLAKAGIMALAGFSEGGVVGEGGKRIPFPSLNIGGGGADNAIARVRTGEVIGTPAQIAGAGIGGITVLFNNYGAIGSDVDVSNIGNLLGNSIQNTLRGAL